MLAERISGNISTFCVLTYMVIVVVEKGKRIEKIMDSGVIERLRHPSLSNS